MPTTADPNGLLRVSWTMPAGNVARVRVLRRDGACPTGIDDPAAQAVGDFESSAGAAQSTDDVVTTAGVYCYAVFALGALGRPGAVATVSHTYLGRPPIANFDSRPTAPRTVAVHRSIDRPRRSDRRLELELRRQHDVDRAQPDAHVLRPRHLLVTLTVTDNTGQTDSYTREVRVIVTG